MDRRFGLARTAALVLVCLSLAGGSVCVQQWLSSPDQVESPSGAGTQSPTSTSTWTESPDHKTPVTTPPNLPPPLTPRPHTCPPPRKHQKVQTCPIPQLTAAPQGG